MGKILLTAFLAFATSTTTLNQMTGKNVISGHPEVIPLKDAVLGTVIVFLSAKCPCSDSHLQELKSLSSQYNEFRFVGVHANADESEEFAKQYFTKAELPFVVLQDKESKIANLLKALKTPHAYVLNPQGEVLYQGGVTNSAHAEKADVHFLGDALADLVAKRPVKIKEGRTLGCILLRDDTKNSW